MHGGAGGGAPAKALQRLQRPARAAATETVSRLKAAPTKPLLQPFQKNTPHKHSAQNRAARLPIAAIKKPEPLLHSQQKLRFYYISVLSVQTALLMFSRAPARNNHSVSKYCTKSSTSALFCAHHGCGAAGMPIGSAVPISSGPYSARIFW